MKINCSQNKWTECFVAAEEKNVLRGENYIIFLSVEKEAVSFPFKEISSFDDIKDFFSGISVGFSGIILSENKVQIFSDPACSIPLFYCIDKQRLLLTDNVLRISSYGKKRSSLEELSLFLMSGYMQGNQTLFDNIHTLVPGEVVSFFKKDKNIDNQASLYFSPVSNEVGLDPLDLSVFIQQTKDLFLELFQKLYPFLKNRKIIVPLSGGYDSRLVLCYLKELGLENVLCYTYDSENSFDTLISKKVAKVLGYPWVFIPYNNQIWQEIYSSGDFLSWYNAVFNYTSIPHLQDFPALWEMNKNKTYDFKDSVFMTGHSGDIFGGSLYEPKYKTLNFKTTLNKQPSFIAEVLFEHLYWHWRMDSGIRRKVKKVVIEKVREASASFASHHSVAAFMEHWRWVNKSKYLMISMKNYQFYEGAFINVFWNQKIVEHFFSLPWQNRFKDNFFHKFVFSVFEKYRVPFLKTEISANQYGLTPNSRRYFYLRKFLLAIGMRKNKFCVESLFDCLSNEVSLRHKGLRPNTDVMAKMSLYSLRKSLNENIGVL